MSLPAAGSGSSSVDPASVPVTLSYVGGLARRMGCKTEELLLDPPLTVQSVLDRLVENHGDDVRDLFFNQYGWLDPRLFFLIDGEGANVKGGLEATITGREEITLILGIPMTGG